MKELKILLIGHNLLTIRMFYPSNCGTKGIKWARQTDGAKAEERENCEDGVRGTHTSA